MTEEQTPLVRVTPQDLWPEYEGPGQYPPEDEVAQKSFDQARRYDLLHRNAPGPLVKALEMPAEALKWAREGNRSNLLLWGPVGAGKSFSAVATGTLYAALHGRSFWFTNATAFFRGVKNHSDKDAMEEARAMAMRPEVLLLDDVGRTKLTEVDVESMTELLDERSARSRITIFTTNSLPIDFEERFGDHLTSRILGGTTIIHMHGRDRRQNP